MSVMYLYVLKESPLYAYNIIPLSMRNSKNGYR